MLERALELIQEHGTLILAQHEYIETHDWSGIHQLKPKIKEYQLQSKLIESLIKKLEYVKKEAPDHLSKDERIKEFVEGIATEISNFINRSNTYFATNNWQELDLDDMSVEVDFQDTLLKDVIKYKDKLKQLNILEENKEVIVVTYGGAIIPLAMREGLEERYPEIKDMIANKSE